MAFKTLLFHTRFRELAFNSLKTVLELKAAGLKKVVLAHVIPREDVAFVPYGGTLKEDEKRIREEARLKFDDWIQTIGDPQLEFHQRIEVGATNAAILDMAKAEKADLIVVGRKKRTTLEKVYVGTHILDILRRSDVPVLMSKYMVNYEWQGESADAHQRTDLETAVACIGLVGTLPARPRGNAGIERAGGKNNRHPCIGCPTNQKSGTGGHPAP
jgi:nucleotide-binding universal stress UspA family protein